MHKISIGGRNKKWTVLFHKCNICGAIFHYCDKRCYCSKCMPKHNGWSYGYSTALNYGFILAERREREKQQLRKELDG